MTRNIFPVILFFTTYYCNSQEVADKFESVFVNNHDNFSEVGLVVSISNSDGRIWEKAAGFSDRSFGIKTSADHKFRIGSITKQFTAVAILKLVEEHKLSLDDTVHNYFPDLKGGKQITIEHLLTHTSGISDYTTKPEWLTKYSKLFSDPRDVYDFIKDDNLRFPPGSQYEYNNSGYHLLGLIIENESGMSYSDYLEKVIFDPLEMTNTSSLDSEEVIKNMAKGYDVFGEKISYPDFVHPAQPFSSGSLVSTTGDLHKWYKGLLAGSIISKENLDKAFTPYSLNDSSKTNYGYGWQVQSIDEIPVIHHNGSYPGYISEVHFFPESGVLITALSNAMPLSRLMKELGSVAHGKEVKELKFLELSAEALTGFMNEYANDSENWKFLVEEDSLFYTVNGGPKTKILPVSPTKFYSPDWDIFIEFVANPENWYTSFLLHWNGEKYTYNLKDSK